MPSIHWRATIFVSLFLLVSSTQLLDEYEDLDAPRLRCLSNDDGIKITTFGEIPVDMQPALKLAQNYKLVIRYTDTTSYSTAKITESNFTDALVIHKVQQNNEETFYFNSGVTHLKGKLLKIKCKIYQF